MPFKDDSPFEKRIENLDMDLENGKEIEKPLLDDHDEAQTGEQSVEVDGLEGETTGLPTQRSLLAKHVHFSESLQRAIAKREHDEELGLVKHYGDEEDEEEEDEDEGSWEDFWEWVKAETKCYANYICPVVVVNAGILLLVIVYFYNQKD